ncbi:WYL domain-containing protein [Mesorhizobium sp. ASY16-5R]|uniref:WYL domain-containing protein n=1 Tax=Mesorhizobium sp. ASY16-5R TaxID=3445772 RepID=UPI003F9ED409
MSAKILVDLLVRHVEAQGIPEAPVVVALPDNDDPIDTEAKFLGYAEGQSFAIEYIDSSGNNSSRRITVYNIIAGRGGAPSLFARCHERRQMRQFRVDRIQCCVDYNGEVHEDVPRFLFENFGMSLSTGRIIVDKHADKRWAEILASVRDEVVVLAALSHSDGSVVTSETTAAARYQARKIEAAGILLSDQEIASLGSHVRRVRPTVEAIERALASMLNLEVVALQKFLNAAIQVIDADGKRHPEEMALLDRICIDLTGTSIQ